MNPDNLFDKGFIVIVTCDVCGSRMKVERKFHSPETFYIVCHCCEAILGIQWDQEEWSKTEQRNFFDNPSNYHHSRSN